MTADGPGRLELTFLTFVPYEEPGHAARSLREALELFAFAEGLRYDVGWVRVRHLERFLSSPLTFLAAAAGVTSRMRLGTAVLPMRYMDPVLLAEDAATVDLLSGGRLELGLAGGIAPMAPVLDRVFGRAERGFGEEAWHRIGRLRAALRGEPVAVLGKDGPYGRAGTKLTVTPHAPGLADRLWYGPGSRATAERTGREGMNLLVSTLNTEDTGQNFEEGQRQQILAYKEAFDVPGRLPRVNAGRIVLPSVTTADDDRFRDYVEWYAGRFDERGRPRDGSMGVFGRTHHGRPEEVVASLRADVALAEATGLDVVLPANATLDMSRRILENVAAHVAPELGWTPAG
ncbi:LLM class flavin-dependent oxidoreductase [Georgenia sp. AZ-5]|uniref:LLM class flavin-dependent oxidoreductase n=1 Tax=Georgenia sp. AZ-5 TaxID=3367526 RepID=UPI0037547965